VLWSAPGENCRHRGSFGQWQAALTAAAGIPSQAAPGIRARVLLGAAWSAYSRGDLRRAAPLATDGIACARQAGEPQLEFWGRNLLAGVAWLAGDADQVPAQSRLVRPGRSGARGAGRTPDS